jgi:fatty acid kinase fatty acid binding subunit
MPTVTIVTDSSACLPDGVLGDLPITVLPIMIHLRSGDLRDGMDDAAPLVYRSLERGESVKSSAPSPVEYLAAIEAAEGPVVVISPATEFTAMYRNAAVAAEMSGRPVPVVDSRTAAAAHGLVVLAAAAMAAEGGAVEEVVERAEEAGRRAGLVAALDGVDFIRRSGRVPMVALQLAHQLGIRPVFRLSGGAVERVGVPRSLPAAMRRIRKEAVAGGLRDAPASFVFHAAAPERAAALQELLGEGTDVTEFSPSMGIHTGPGVVGVAWLRSVA